jgi:glycosyltransferase involved in cell wall biosynthesis
VVDRIAHEADEESCQNHPPRSVDHHPNDGRDVMDTGRGRGIPSEVSPPTITVVIPLYNGREFIQAALDSVSAQTLAPTEIIVVDDGSTDNGPDIVARLAESHPIRLLRKENGGQSSARNLGIANARGSLIALLDQDDIWYSDHLEELVKPFLEPRSAELGWVYSNLDEIDAAGRMIGHAVLDRCTTPHPKDSLFSCLREDMYILPTATLMSRAAAVALGGFDEALSGYEDDDLFLRMFRAGYDHAYIERPLARWRVYSTSSSYSPRMARSRMIFARKLMRDFPDDVLNTRFFCRDLIVPRFLPQAIVEARKALRSGDQATIETCMADVESLRGLLSKESTTKLTYKDFLISVIIPLYNGGEFIQEALESVLAQTVEPDEIIVVDDGSTDDGPEIVQRMAQSHPIRMIRKDNGGQSSARNVGIANAHGDLIALLDQDDIWYPNHIAVLLEPFVEGQSRNLGWTYSNLDRVDQDGSVLMRSFLTCLPTVHPKRTLNDCLAQDMFVVPSATLVSRKAIQAVGGFDETLSGYEDDDLYLRLFRAGYHNEFVNEPLSKWRIYPTSSSYSSRMAKSRMIFARKLMRDFPDDVLNARFFCRDLIVPRFLPQAIIEARKALRSGDEAAIETSMADVELLRGLLSKESTTKLTYKDFLISVIIPMYNGGEFIQEALESVLAQTVEPDEIIVVDDGSTDDGPEIVQRMAQSHPIRMIRKANGGQSSARNVGIANAHGDLIALLDQDDIWYPDHIAALLEPFAAGEAQDLGWTYSNLDRVDRDGSMLMRSFLTCLPTVHPKRTMIDCLTQDMFVVPSATLVSRKAIQAVGGFDEALRGYEDDDLFLRLFRAGYDNRFVNEPLSKWRIYPTSSSYSPRMARSRRIYAEKLLRAYPDEPREVKFYTTRVIAPRFLAHMLMEYRRAILYGTPGDAGLVYDDLCFIRGFLHWRTRMVVSALLPLLRFQPLARVLLVLAGLMRGLLPSAPRGTIGMIT